MVVKACLTWNLRVFGKHLSTEKNYLADALSRGQMSRFWKDVKKDKLNVNPIEDQVPQELWPVEKIWIK